MAETIQFYLDQHFPSAVSQGVRRHGVDVLTTQDAGRCGLSDAEQLSFAATQERIMVTFDPDFLALHRSGAQHAGTLGVPSRKTA